MTIEADLYPGSWGAPARFAYGAAHWFAYPTEDNTTLVTVPLGASDGGPIAPPTTLSCGAFIPWFDIAVLDDGDLAVMFQCEGTWSISVFPPGEEMPPFVPVYTGFVQLPPAIASSGDIYGVLFWPSDQSRPRVQIFDRNFMVIGDHAVGVPRTDIPIGIDLAVTQGDPPIWAVAYTYANPGQTFVQRFEICR
jgi:hypothetical protein